jgi:hypothetical protein
MLENAIRHTGSESQAWLTPSPPTARAVTLYLDTPGTPEWTPLPIIDDHARLGTATRPPRRQRPHPQIHPDAAAPDLLLATGNAELVEGNARHDNYRG